MTTIGPSKLYRVKRRDTFGSHNSVGMFLMNKKSQWCMKAFKGLIEQKDLIGSLVRSGDGVVLYRASVKSEAAAAEE